MINYQQGKIYKIINSVNNMIYIGSTCRLLCERMGQHRSAARNAKKHYLLYIEMRKTGIEHFSIILVESYPCENKEALRARENHWMDTMKPQLNSRGSILNKENQKLTNSRNHQQWYQKNREYTYTRVYEQGRKKVTCKYCNMEMNYRSYFLHRKRKQHKANLLKTIDNWIKQHKKKI